MKVFLFIFSKGVCGFECETEKRRGRFEIMILNQYCNMGDEFCCRDRAMFCMETE